MLTVVACVVQCIGDHRGGMASSDAVSTQALYVAECVLLLRVYFTVFFGRYTSASLCAFAPTCALLLQSGGLKAAIKRLQGMPPPPRDMMLMASCVHAVACVGAAAGQEAFRTVAGDAVTLLLVNVLAQDVLLSKRATQASSSTIAHHAQPETSAADTAALHLMYPPPPSPSRPLQSKLPVAALTLWLFCSAATLPAVLRSRRGIRRWWRLWWQVREGCVCGLWSVLVM